MLRCYLSLYNDLSLYIVHHGMWWCYCDCDALYQKAPGLLLLLLLLQFLLLLLLFMLHGA